MAARIPPSEWDAIVLRREQGESVNFIARSYGCSPPAIYSILKRHKGDGVAADGDELGLDDEGNDEAGEGIEAADGTETPRTAESPQIAMPLVQPETAPAPEILRQAAPLSLTPRDSSPAVPPQGNTLRAPPSIGTGHRLGAGDLRQPDRHAEAAPAAQAPNQPSPGQQVPTQQTPAQQAPTQHQPVHAFEQSAQRAQVPAALTARLDAELRTQANTAVDIFKAAFDAALATDSQDARKQLRQASADLMRVAARTTIVLERLEAVSSRTALPIIPPRRVEPDNTQRDFNQRQRQRPGPR